MQLVLQERLLLPDRSRVPADPGTVQDVAVHDDGLGLQLLGYGTECFVGYGDQPRPVVGVGGDQDHAIFDFVRDLLVVLVGPFRSKLVGTLRHLHLVSLLECQRRLWGL